MRTLKTLWGCRRGCLWFLLGLALIVVILLIVAVTPGSSPFVGTTF